MAVLSVIFGHLRFQTQLKQQPVLSDHLTPYLTTHHIPRQCKRKKKTAFDSLFVKKMFFLRRQSFIPLFLCGN